MSTAPHNNCNDWKLIADLHFKSFEEFSDAVNGWDFDFHQLTAGRSVTSVLQIGNPDFMYSRFFLEQAYKQQAGLPQDVWTFGIPEAGDNEVTTPGGIVQQNDILCVPSGHDLVAITRPQFTGYSVSVSEARINQVVESCGLQRTKLFTQQDQMVLRCNPEKIAALRKSLRNISWSQGQISKTESHSAIFHELEFNLIQYLLLTYSDSRSTDKLRISKIKQARLQRALDFIEANVDKSITVTMLAEATGSTVRTLEYIFRDYFDTTPKSFLKSRRMNAVRGELQTALDRNESIAEIANRWGFWHHSQFAADYRRFFGELPSETIKTAGSK